jgi:hypothetical protein
MSERFKVLGQAHLSVLPTVIYKVPETPVTQNSRKTQAIVKVMNICNQIGSASVVKEINVVKSGESASDRNRIVYFYAFTANETKTFPCGFTLEEGDSIIASSITGTLSISLFGVEMY